MHRMPKEDIEAVANRVLEQYLRLAGEHPVIPVEVSARHVHLTAEAVQALFRQDAALLLQRELSQPGEFLCRQRVTVLTPHGRIPNVAVLGPVRSAVQVELSLTDARQLGLCLPVNLSGNLTDAGDVCLLGESGLYYAPGSAIAAKAHIHMTSGDAARFAVTDGQLARVRIDSPRPVTLEQVVVRVSDRYSLAMHIDFDEANACALTTGAATGTIL